VAVDAGAAELYGEERFGPIGFVIAARDRDAALVEATGDARAAVRSPRSFTRPTRTTSRCGNGYSASGAQLTCNLTGPMPLNFAAAYSDYHVTG